jgi:hypothetical protein
MPNYTPMALIKRYDGKTDIHSKAIRIICDAAMNGIGPHFAFASRHSRAILRVLMAHTGWNMVLVGNIPADSYHPDGVDANLWADVIDIAAEAELEEDAPRVEKILVCPEGIMVKFKHGETWGAKLNSKAYHRRLQTAISKTAVRFSDYDSWGETPLRPVVAEE